MSGYTIEKLLEDTARISGHKHKISLSLLTLVWQHLSAYLCTQLKNGKAVALQAPQLGRFTFQKEIISSTTNAPGLSTDALSKRRTSLPGLIKEQYHVVFALNESFCRSHDIKFQQKPFDQSIPLVECNYFIIAQRCSVLKETVMTALKLIVERLGQVMKSGKKVSIEFHRLGQLMSDRKISEFTFFSEWEKPLEMKRSGGGVRNRHSSLRKKRRVSRRASSTPRMIHKSSKQNPSGAPKDESDDFDVLDVDEWGSVATLSEINEYHPSHSGEKKRPSPPAHSPPAVEDSPLQKKNPMPPTPKRPKSSSSGRGFSRTYKGSAVSTAQRKVPLPIPPASIAGDEKPLTPSKPPISKHQIPSTPSRNRRNYSGNVGKVSEALQKKAQARSPGASHPPSKEHAQDDDTASIAVSDVFSSVSNPTQVAKPPRQPQKSMQPTFPELNQSPKRPSTAVEALYRRMSVQTPNSPIHQSFLSKASSTQENHVEAITKHIDNTPYRARKVSNAALNSAMLEAFHRHEAQLLSKMEQEEREELDRQWRMQRNERAALKEQEARKKRNKELQEFHRKQMDLSQKFQNSLIDSQKKATVDSFNSKIGVPTTKVYKKRRQRGIELQKALQQQLEAKKRRERMLQKYDREEGFKLVQSDQESYQKEREYLARRKQETRELLNKSWDHQVMLNAMRNNFSEGSSRRRSFSGTSRAASGYSVASGQSRTSTWTGMGKVLY